MDITTEASKIRMRRSELAEQETKLATDTITFVQAMPDTMGVREIAALVGLSPARVAQIIPGRRRAGRPRNPAPAENLQS